MAVNHSHIDWKDLKFDYNGGFINFHNVGIRYIIDSFEVKKPQNHTTSPFVGRNSSTTKFVSSDGRVISFKSLCLADETGSYKGKKIRRIRLYRYLANVFNQRPAVLTSLSKSDIDGNYILTGFDYKEDTSGNFEINWEFTEVIKFNVTQKTFRVWNKAQLTGNNNKGKGKGKGKAKTLKVDSNTKKLLKDCGVMKRNDNKHGIKCVKILQRFLQKNGYYMKYKVDGWYSKYTEAEVKKLQKANKLRATGGWNKTTRKYFQKKYNYPRVEAIPTKLVGNKAMTGLYVVD